MVDVVLRFPDDASVTLDSEDYPTIKNFYDWSWLTVKYGNQILTIVDVELDDDGNIICSVDDEPPPQ